jgi:RND family efflux transporter MFP subunit
VVLSPRVSGEIVELSPGFTPGGFVEKGQTLLRIDPADFQNALEQRQSDLRQAEADLRVEMGRQNVARQDYELLDQSLAEENRELVLREPQLNAAQARVEAARAAVEQAELALQRTEVKAPFDAQVIERNVNVGSQVSPGDRLGHLVGIETYWVVATVPLTKLRWIEFPNPETGQKHGTEVRVRNRTAWPEGVTRVGHVDRLIGSLDEETRLARVLVTVDDPLARQMSGGMNADMSTPPMIIGAVVEAGIQGRELPDVIRLDRDFIRENDTVWVKENYELQIRQVTIAVRDAQYAYITEGLEHGDAVVTSNLATVAEGAPLRVNTPAGGSMAETQTGTAGEEATP